MVPHRRSPKRFRGHRRVPVEYRVWRHLPCWPERPVTPPAGGSSPATEAWRRWSVAPRLRTI